MKRKAKTRVITDGLEILERRYFSKDPDMRRRVEEEFQKLQIGQQIYNLRQEAGLTQKQLADLIGTTHSVISRLEDANYDGHSLKILQRIAASLGKCLTVRIENKNMPKKRKVG